MKKAFLSAAVVAFSLWGIQSHAQDVVSASSSTAALQDSEVAESKVATEPVPGEKNVEFRKSAKLRYKHTVDLDYSYVTESKVKNGDANLGDGLEEQSFKFGYKTVVPINEQWAIMGSVGYGRFDFGGTPNTVLPQNLESTNFGLGASYRLDSNWSVFASVVPKIQQVNGESAEVFMSGFMGANYQWNPSLGLRFGLAISPDSGTSVFPLLGVNWKFAEKWNLQIGMPRSRVTYALTDKVDLWTGFELDGGTYKTDDHYGDDAGRADLNNRKITYTEIKGGIGADYKITETVILTGEIGSALYRQLEFKDGDKVKADPSLMTQIGVRVNF